MIILPTLREDLKRLFLKFAITGRRRVLKICFRTIEAYLLLLAQTKLDSRILKNQQLIQHHMKACKRGDVVKYCDDLSLCNINIFICKWQKLVVNHSSEYI